MGIFSPSSICVSPSVAFYLTSSLIFFPSFLLLLLVLKSSTLVALASDLSCFFPLFPISLKVGGEKPLETTSGSITELKSDHLQCHSKMSDRYRSGFLIIWCKGNTQRNVALERKHRHAQWCTHTFITCVL